MRNKIIFIVIVIIIFIVILNDNFIYTPIYSSVPDGKVTRPIIIDISNDTWPQYRLTVTHDGRAHPSSSLNGTLSKTWTTIDINTRYYGASKSSPAVDLDMVYVGADTGNLYSFWRSNGTIAWSYQTLPSENGIHSSPAFDGEKVYVGAYDGWLYAVYKNNGTLAWNSKLGDYIGSSPCIYNGVVYIGVEMSAPAGYLVGCDVDTGTEVFRSERFGDHPHSSPSVDPSRNYAYIGSNDNHVYCYDLVKKQEIWSYRTGGAIKATPCIAGDVLYVTSWDNNLYAIDLVTGVKYFTFETGQKSMSSPTIDSSGTRLYFGSHDGFVYCIDSRDGSEYWRFKTKEIILSSPTLVELDNMVVCGSNDRHLYLLDATTGKVKTDLNIRSGISSVPVVVENQLYIFDNEGRLHRYDSIRDNSTF